MADVIETKSLLILADGENAVFDGEVFPSEDKVDAGVSGCPRNIDAANPRVRMRGAQQFAMGHAGKGNVVGEAGLTSDFGARIYAAACMADYTEIAVVSRLAFVSGGFFDSGICVPDFCACEI